jgi:hypothetical protein
MLSLRTLNDDGGDDLETGEDDASQVTVQIQFGHGVPLPNRAPGDGENSAHVEFENPK